MPVTRSRDVPTTSLTRSSPSVKMEVPLVVATEIATESKKRPSPVELTTERKKQKENVEAAHPGLCQYELSRLEKISVIQAKLADLGVQHAHSQLAAEQTKPKPRAPTKRGVRKQRVPLEPSRRSLRVKGEKANNVYVESERAGGKVNVGGGDATAIVAHSESVAISRKLQRLPEEELTLESSEGLQRCIIGADCSTGTEVFGREFLDSLRKLSEKEDKPVIQQSTMDYAERLAQLKLSEDYVCKVVPERIYAINVHPSNHELVICAGDKSGHLGLWNADQQEEGENDGVVLYHPHASPLNILEWSQGSRLYSTAYDNSVRCLDVNKGTFDFVYGAVADPDDWLQCSCLGKSSWCPDTIVLGDSAGMGTCVDLRTKQPTWTAQFHDKKINTVDLHPSLSYLVTASLDRCCKIWDLRKMGSKAKPKPVCVLSDQRSVNSASFNPTGSAIVSVTQANFLRIWHDSHLRDGVLPESAACNVRHDNQTGRYQSVFHARWDPKETSAFVVGSMCRPRQVEVYSYQANSDTKKKPSCHRIMSLQV